jgi:hypothetical protein
LTAATDGLVLTWLADHSHALLTYDVSTITERAYRRAMKGEATRRFPSNPLKTFSDGPR